MLLVFVTLFVFLKSLIIHAEETLRSFWFKSVVFLLQLLRFLAPDLLKVRVFPHQTLTGFHFHSGDENAAVSEQLRLKRVRGRSEMKQRVTWFKNTQLSVKPCQIIKPEKKREDWSGYEAADSEPGSKDLWVMKVITHRRAGRTKF